MPLTARGFFYARRKFVGRNKRARGKAGVSRNFLQSHQQAHGALRLYARVRGARDRKAISLSAEVNGGPKPVVVVISANAR